ncbi:hypothetical protein FDK21_14740 [Cohaesibacter sp. CAU 1516]|uniref:hypothetical protein n=1 Tax=Cohaesibacter sp. CAU 1516 TaxID=2576038 RepID=UPI0010FD14F3|nr:hypothetical protein [Cohaesibacter sp. CAU 1516]TLP45008.1 hypothetical protein FDK21_14740 [Cohaesibacter sp. CAU 1516]
MCFAIEPNAEAQKWKIFSVISTVSMAGSGFSCLDLRQFWYETTELWQIAAGRLDPVGSDL